MFHGFAFLISCPEIHKVLDKAAFSAVFLRVDEEKQIE